ncbi:MAG: helix-turn-helix domain-containing protein [Verrucomicrobia bacterium]|jgi:AraC-like DNA-binding protein|nr:helix-turn-helix domain-containing protein [Verrucomicrobiota bacterium]
MQNLARYFPSDPSTFIWGWRILDAGRQKIAPGAAYPSEGHPTSYRFDANGRRVLDEFQIVFIESGSGFFESASVPQQRIFGGTALILFPGEWHRYGPHPDTGWQETWVGFSGDEALRLMPKLFDSREPLRIADRSEEILKLFNRLLDWSKRETVGEAQIAANHIPLILAFLKADPEMNQEAASRDARLIQRAKTAMLKNISVRTNLQHLARDLGCSYSRLRTTFKQQTGYAPREFENHIKLNRSRDLLLHDQLSVSETADALGYSSVYYFSRAFKRAFGKSPAKWLNERL